MSKAFESGLRNYLDDAMDLTRQEKRLKRVLALPASNSHRKRTLGQVESAMIAQLAVQGKTKIDWTKIDWADLLEWLAPLIKIIIDLFGP